MSKHNEARAAITAPAVVAADTLEGGRVLNPRGETLGILEEIMIDVRRGTIAYAVMSCGSPAMGDKRVAVAWSELTRDDERQCFVLDSDGERLAKAPGLTYR